MPIKLNIGVRGTVREFLNSYTTNFLIDHGWVIDDPDLLMLQTRKGVLAEVSPENTVTYIGNNIWSIN